MRKSIWRKAIFLVLVILAMAVIGCSSGTTSSDDGSGAVSNPSSDPEKSAGSDEGSGRVLDTGPGPGQERPVTIGPLFDESDLLPETSDFFAIANNVQNSVPYADDGDPDHVMNILSPEGEGPFPALVVFHDGNFNLGERSDPFFPRFYAQRGFVAFSIDYQLSDPETPSWPAAVQDVVCAVRHIKQNAELYRIDPDRMAVMGQGVGGYLSLMVGTLQGDEDFLEGACGDPTIDSQVALVVDISGFPDLEGYSKEKPESERFDEYLGGAYADNPDLWRLASPVSHVSSDDGAVFVISQGSLDVENPIGPVRQFVERLEESGVETHFLEIEGAGHTLTLTQATEGLLSMRRVLEPLMKDRLRP